MKKNKFTPICAIALVLLMGSCTKEQDPNLNPGNSMKQSAGRLPYRAVVNLGKAANYSVLSQSGIKSTYPTSISGNTGLYPAACTCLFLQCTETFGNIYTADAGAPGSCRIMDPNGLKSAVTDMQTAYKEITGRTNANYYNLGEGNIGGKTLSSGFYKWTGSVTIPTSVTLTGGPNDIWIFQVSGTLNMSSGMFVHLKDGAQAKNVYWVVAGDVTIQSHSQFSGIILGKAGITIQRDSHVFGRLLSQTSITLESCTVREPVKQNDGTYDGYIANVPVK